MHFSIWVRDGRLHVRISQTSDPVVIPTGSFFDINTR